MRVTVEITDDGRVRATLDGYRAIPDPTPLGRLVGELVTAALARTADTTGGGRRRG